MIFPAHSWPLPFLLYKQDYTVISSIRGMPFSTITLYRMTVSKMTLDTMILNQNDASQNKFLVNDTWQNGTQYKNTPIQQRST